MKRFELWRDYGTLIFDSDDLLETVQVYEKVYNLDNGYDILDTKSGYWLLGKDWR